MTRARTLTVQRDALTAIKFQIIALRDSFSFQDREERAKLQDAYNIIDEIFDVVDDELFTLVEQPQDRIATIK